jgi:hypothetical protein
MNPYDAVMTIENGTESESEWIDAMQYLINSGLAWQLQGSFGRAAQWAIESGLCYEPTQKESN